jgi:hypothetical protein
LVFLFFFGFSSDSGLIFFYFFLFFARFWMVNEVNIFGSFLTLRLAAFDGAKPALPHPVRPRRARTSRWFSPATAGRRVD